jgi:hypothetical protein
VGRTAGSLELWSCFAAGTCSCCDVFLSQTWRNSPEAHYALHHGPVNLPPGLQPQSRAHLRCMIKHPKQHSRCVRRRRRLPRRRNKRPRGVHSCAAVPARRLGDEDGHERVCCGLRGLQRCVPAL